MSVAQAAITFKEFVNIMEIEEEKPNFLVLDENNENNSYTLYQNKGKTVNVELKRNLKANKWNSLSLPFALTGEQVKQYFGNTVILKEPERLGDTSKGENEKSIVMKDATSIEPGKPYFIKPSVNTDIMQFENVKIATSVGVITEIGVEPVQALFVSTFNKSNLSGSGYYVLNEDGKLNIAPEASGETDEYFVPGFISFIAVPDNWYREEVEIIFDTTISGLNNLNYENASTSNKVYTIDGRYVGTSTQGLAEGLYIVNGKKQIVR